jgi:hypothetical protein
VGLFSEQVCVFPQDIGNRRWLQVSIPSKEDFRSAGTGIERDIMKPKTEKQKIFKKGISVVFRALFKRMRIEKVLMNRDIIELEKECGRLKYGD